uniref:Uncharacterized protein n=1 Tax=Candidatus Kentrum eta TaxID=2126337 RepID=A0A450V3M6_9GAMM|nr:MAG: hypothetical protein BECKH772A_GA0070896_101612 [Candidatus Kentron sp. H]VFK04028.1 MAG: hypothetical protein BECKH772C_GA0070978_1015715 [Candidatus Kentron sp. H]
MKHRFFPVTAHLAVGGQIMQEATQVYNYVKTAAKTTPGLKPIADQLGERWKVAKQKKSPESAE